MAGSRRSAWGRAAKHSHGKYSDSAFLAKCSQFLTKSIITAEPKVKCSVVLAGSYGASCPRRQEGVRSRPQTSAWGLLARGSSPMWHTCACAWLLKSRLVCGGSSHSGTPRLLVLFRAGAAIAAGGALASPAPRCCSRGTASFSGSGWVWGSSWSS